MSDDATTTPEGTPAPEAPQTFSLEYVQELRQENAKHRTGKAAREELSGSTITISSLGPMGGITSPPVINRPEVATIAVNKVVEKLVPVPA